MIDSPPSMGPPPDPAPARQRASLLPIATVAVAVAIFIADTFTPPDCIVGGLYVVVILMAGRFCEARRLWQVALGCIGLTIVAQFLAHRYVLENDQAAYIGIFNSSVTIVAVGLSCYLVLRGRTAEAAMRQAQADLARMSRVTTMGELTASIAHEVNQPIAGVVTNAGACLRWLAADKPDLDKAREAASRIVRDGTRAAEIISRIRQVFTRGSPEQRALDLNQMTRETADLLGGEAKQRQVAVKMELASDLPQIVGDRIQLQQVVVNLIVNGLDAMRDVEGTRDLVLRSRLTPEGEAMVSVSDTGVGLPGPQTDQLFDAFFTTKPHGTGMGLSISRSIIEAHRGRLWATPNTPRGAIFQFVIPIGDDAQA